MPRIGRILKKPICRLRPHEYYQSRIGTAGRTRVRSRRGSPRHRSGMLANPRTARTQRSSEPASDQPALNLAERNGVATKLRAKRPETLDYARRTKRSCVAQMLFAWAP